MFKKETTFNNILVETLIFLHFSLPISGGFLKGMEAKRESRIV